jgi:hypothetical protein
LFRVSVKFQGPFYYDDFRNIFSVATAKIYDKSFAGNRTPTDFRKYDAEIKPNDRQVIRLF